MLEVILPTVSSDQLWSVSPVPCSQASLELYPMGSSGPPPCPRELFRSWSWDNSTGVVLAPLWSDGLRMPWPALWTAALCTLTRCVCQNSEPRGQGCLNWEPPLLSSSPTLGLTSGQDCGPSGPTLLGGCNALAAGVPQPSSPPSRDCGRTSWETLRQACWEGGAGGRGARAGRREERQRKGCGKWQAPEGGE